MVVMDKSLYYSPQKLLSYDRILNFVIGGRGIGKSYGWKEHPIKRFLKYGEQIIYLRRYKTEMKKIKNYFNDIQDAFPGHEFKVKGWELYIDDKLFGWAVPLSAFQNEKSTAYPNVTTIIFDEFLREGNRGYLQDEVDTLLNFMDTVFRTRDNVRCVCLSNSVSIVNPYFLYFNLHPDTSKRFTANESIVVEIVNSEGFAQERRKTRFGQLINGTEYGDYSLDNQFINDSDTFIEKRSPNSKFKFSIIYKGMTMGLWVDEQLGQMYLSVNHDPLTKNLFAITKDDMTEKSILVHGWKNHYHILKMVRCFQKGILRFENQVMRNIGYEVLKKLNIM